MEEKHIIAEIVLGQSHANPCPSIPANHLKKAVWVSWFCWFFKDIQSLKMLLLMLMLKRWLDFITPPTLITKKEINV